MRYILTAALLAALITVPTVGFAEQPASPSLPPAPSAAQQSRHAPASYTNQFATEAEAKAHCPSGVVVWLNTRSKVYHLAGTGEYGKTRSGAYMCREDAARAGNLRAAKNELPVRR
jgi:hypothetical protein